MPAAADHQPLMSLTTSAWVDFALHIVLAAPIARADAQSRQLAFGWLAEPEH